MKPECLEMKSNIFEDKRNEIYFVSSSEKNNIGDLNEFGEGIYIKKETDLNFKKEVNIDERIYDLCETMHNAHGEIGPIAGCSSNKVRICIFNRKYVNYLLQQKMI